MAPDRRRLPRIMSTEDNLPPEEGPFDEDVPLLEADDPVPRAVRAAKRHKRLLCGSALLLLVFFLLITTVAFAALYFHLLRDNSRLPKWPKPSLSPLGKYSRAAVAADHEMCSEIGRDTLLHGGNAVDAAVATLFCIGVMDTQSAGLGGGHFMTIYNATTKKCTVIDAREVAPLAATEEMYKPIQKRNESKYGWKAVAVPGEVHGMWTAYQKFGSGRIRWSSLVRPTIDLLEEGFPTSHHLAMAFLQNEAKILSEKTMKEFVNPKTKGIYKVGEQIRTRKSLLNTMRLLANSSNPVKTFYEDLAKSMVAEFKANGGILTEEDFRKYRSIVKEGDDIIYTKLKGGRQVCGAPPPAGSSVAQSILSIMDGYSYNTKSFKDIARFYHHFIEASKFAYAGRTWMGDPAFVHNATEIARNITATWWAENVRSKITDIPHPDAYYGGSNTGPPEDHGTTHISVVDTHGNAVSVTTTINLYLGAVVTSESTGVLWNDEMDDFSTPGVPNFFGLPPSPSNYIVPGKRPMSSQSPLIIFGEKDELLVLGGAGGSTIISGVAGVALQALWLKADVKQAVDAPRMHNQLSPNYTRVEPNFPKEYIADLTARGHIMKPVNNLTVVTAVKKAGDGQLYANSDFRKGEESAPAGY